MPFQDMFNTKPFSPFTVLLYDVGTSDTRLYLDDVSIVPAVPTLLTLETDADLAEVVSVTAIGSNFVDVTRGYVGDAKAHTANTVVARNFSSKDQDIIAENLIFLRDRKTENSMLSNMAIATIKGNASAAPAAPSDLTASEARGIVIEGTSAIDVLSDDDKFIVEDESASVGSKTKHTFWSTIKTLLRAIFMPNDAVSSNLLVNGMFNDWLRGTSFTAGGYLADRWCMFLTGSSSTVTRQAFTVGQTDVPANPTYYIRNVVTSVSGAANRCMIFQPIESVKKCAGGNVTVSFYAKADAAKNIAIEFFQNFGTGGTPSTTVTGIGAQKIAITTSWVKYAVTVAIPSISGKTLGTTQDGYLAIALWMDAGSSFDARTDSLGQQSGTFEFANVQLNPGSIALPQVQANAAVEGLLRKRMYEKSFPDWMAPAQNTGFVFVDGIQLIIQGVAAGQGQAMGIVFPVEKRVAPTMTFFNPAAANAQVRNLTRNADCSGLSYYASPKAVTVYFTTAAGSQIGDLLGVHWTADSEF